MHPLFLCFHLWTHFLPVIVINAAGPSKFIEITGYNVSGDINIFSMGVFGIAP